VIKGWGRMGEKGPEVGGRVIKGEYRERGRIDG